MTKDKLNAFGDDLEDCKNFKVTVHNFNKEIHKKLVMLRKHKDKFDKEVEFLIGDYFTDNDISEMSHCFGLEGGKESGDKIFKSKRIILKLG